MPGYSDRVLLIEDETDLLSMFSETLAEFGFHVTPCSNLAQAREYLENGTFAILVSDWQVHHEKIDSLLFDPALANLLPASILIVTGYADSLSFNNLLASKFYVLEKPFDVDKLPKVLLEIIQSSRK